MDSPKADLFAEKALKLDALLMLVMGTESKAAETTGTERIGPHWALKDVAGSIATRPLLTVNDGCDIGLSLEQTDEVVVRASESYCMTGVANRYVHRWARPDIVSIRTSSGHLYRTRLLDNRRKVRPGRGV